MTVGVTVPSLIADAIGMRSIDVEADTLAGVMLAIAAHARLGPLVFDDRGHVRPHVLVFHNDTATRHLASLDVPLRPGDRVAVVQAVSGG